MYPNPQDALPLPQRPDLEHYRKRAKELVKAARLGDDALREWVRRWTDTEHRIQQLATFARERLGGSKGGLSEAQFVIARAFGFTGWPALVRHIDGLSQSATDVSTFERAADAIVDGDLATLDRLLRDEPSLVRARSTREHRATLLHYVSANGVENFRQRTPANIVAIAHRLLDAGAAVNAECDVYGGGATTLGLVTTSAHPRAAKVQEALADLLLERGASLDPTAVHSCLMNGCPEAAAHLARRGAPVGFVDAAGIGRLDLLAERFEPHRPATEAEIGSGMMMAAWYDRRDVIGFLLDRGVDVSVRDPKEGQTALHIAAYQGSAALVEFLLARGAALDVTDGAHGTPPLVWALHGWLVDRRKPDDGYRPVLLQLAKAGASVEAKWIDDQRILADGELHAVLAARVIRSPN